MLMIKLLFSTFYCESMIQYFPNNYSHSIVAGGLELMS